MNPTEIVITVASWEDRFRLGMERLLDEVKPSKVLMFYFDEFAHRSQGNRAHVSAMCASEMREIVQVPVSFSDPARSWRTIYSQLRTLQSDVDTITLDITTMPRETIWTLLSLLLEEGINVQYVYSEPESYSEDWLSAEFQRPRLCIKLAGLTRIGYPTTLVMSTGFDVDRTDQLITFFEPRESFLGMQSGQQHNSQNKNINAHKQQFEARSDVHLFEVNCYGTDHGFEAFESHVREKTRQSNVVLCSLGPKLSAVALFNLHLAYPETALAYAPAREFNPKYSSGLGELTVGIIQSASRNL